MDHRKVLSTQITLHYALAIVWFGSIIIVPELFLDAIRIPLDSFIRRSLLGLWQGTTNDLMLYALIPLVVIAAIVFQRQMLTAALYATLLSIDETLDEIAEQGAKKSD